jgi:hypothetical protein
MHSPKYKYENNTLKIEMNENYENHSEENWKLSHHFINTCYFNFYTTKSKRLLALKLTLDEIFTFSTHARHRASKTRALHIAGSNISLHVILISRYVSMNKISFIQLSLKPNNTLKFTLN